MRFRAERLARRIPEARLTAIADPVWTPRRSWPSARSALAVALGAIESATSGRAVRLEEIKQQNNRH